MQNVHRDDKDVDILRHERIGTFNGVNPNPLGGPRRTSVAANPLRLAPEPTGPLNSVSLIETG